MGWLEDFVEHTKHGEAPAKVMYWVGVSTIAGALRRKVWIDEYNFQWTPNFYLLLVGDPGVLKKSTSTGLGMRILKQVPGIDFGPQSVTWEQLITHMAGSAQVYEVGGKEFEASCVTCELSEFGTLFDPSNRQLVDAMTDIFDAKLHTFRKETKTNGCDDVVNPWLNICACTTPGWLEDNFTQKFVRSGFAGRVVYVYCPASEVGRHAHPSRRMKSKLEAAQREKALADQLQTISEYSGEFRLTEEAYEWSEKWYEKFRDFLEGECNEEEIGLYSRKQSHLMKLAMVISASNGTFPNIGVEELMEADRVLETVREDVQTVFGHVGQTPTSKLSRHIVEVLQREGEKTRRELYRKHFFRLVGISQFDEALNNAKASGLVKEAGNLNDPLLRAVC